MKQDVDQLLKFYSSEISDRLMASAAPLKRCFGIDIFWHSSITSDGRFNHISNTPDGTHAYFHNRYYLNNPFLKHPKNYSEGIYLLSDVMQEPYRESQLKYNEMYGIDHILFICKFQDEICHLFGLATSHKNRPMINIYLNNINLLKNFTVYFLEQREPYLDQLKEFEIDLPQLTGTSFYSVNQEITPSPNLKRQQDFLEMLGWRGFTFEQLNALTRREKECLDLYLKGKTAQQTAALLEISRRTVEYHFENIKDKLGCFNKAEILERYSAFKNHLQTT